MVSAMIDFPKWLHFDANKNQVFPPLEGEFFSIYVENSSEEIDKLGIEVSNNDTIQLLKDRALELGIKVDGRWSIERLKEEIAKAE